LQNEQSSLDPGHALTIYVASP